MRSCTLFISLFYAATCFGMTESNELPQDLTYADKPVNSLCFYQAEKLPDKLSLADHCGILFSNGNKPGYIKTGQHDVELIKKGFIGFEYRYVDERGTDNSPFTGYSYYKIIGNYHHDYTIYTINNTGGSGVFTSLYLVKREGDELVIKSLPPGGDRCNGGITDVSQHNQTVTVTVSVNVTPADLLDISKKNPHHLRAYDDLDACEAFCVGTAVYEINLQNKDKPMKFIAINLAADSQGAASLTHATNNKKISIQDCFDEQLYHYYHQVKHTLTPQELDTFMDKFNDSCARKQTG